MTRPDPDPDPGRGRCDAALLASGIRADTAWTEDARAIRIRSRLQAALTASTVPTSDQDLNGPPRGAPSLRGAAVLLPISWQAGAAHLMLTKRSVHLAQHPGQIALPGGKIDPGDMDATAAALREASEETGLPPAQVEVLGALPTHATVTGYEITPILGLIAGPFDRRAEPGEVAEVFDVPLDFVLNPANYRIDGRIWRGRMRRYYIVPWGPYYIWGATARILRGLAERMA